MRLFFVVGSALLAMGSLSAQGDERPKKFEAVSIRVAPELSPQEYAADSSKLRVTISPGMVRMPYESMKKILLRAFGLDGHTQLVGPDWIESRHFAITAKIPEGATARDVPEMLRNMLSERFGMSYRREVRSTAAWTLTVSKTGLKAKAVEHEVPVTHRSAQDPNKRGGIHFELAAPFSGLADFLKESTDFPVVDQTGLPGIYLFGFDFYLFGGRDRDGKRLEPLIGAVEDELPRWFAQGLEPLGIRFAPARLPLENVIIDHLDRVPTEN